MPNSPIVTIGLPISNEPIEILRQTIKSVYAQTVTDWELVIALDGASPEVRTILEQISDPRVRIIGDERNRGVGVRHNQITRAANGTYIAKLDGDDVMHPERLAHQVRFLSDQPENMVVGTGAYIIDQFDEIRGERLPLKAHAKPADALQGVPVTHPTAIARTTWFERHPYDEALIRSQDFGLWISSYRESQFCNLPELLLFYRVSSPMSYQRFSRRYKFARKAMAKLGTNVATKPEIAKAWALTWAKQGVAAAGFATGKQDQFYQRMLRPIAQPELTQAQRVLTEISMTPIPGWIS